MNRFAKTGIAIAAGAALIGTGAAIGSAGSSTAAVAKTVTVTRQVPVPGETKTMTVKVPVPGPTKTVTVSVPAPPPAPGDVISTYSGNGSQVTPAFNVPDDGDFTVTWTYSGNTDADFGDPQATNFSVTDNGGGFGDLPNDIAASGSGSTEVTGANATDSLNVQAAGHWTLTIRAA
jgi:hypothetical protein